MIRLIHKLKAGTIAAVVLLIVGCAATFTNHGYAPTDAELDNILVGIDNRASVEETVGRPASTGVLSESSWFYVASKIRYFTYNKPKVIDRQLVAISFDKRGVVTNIERFTLEDGKVVVISQRVTETGIKGISAIAQILGNIGNVNLADGL